MRRRVPPLLLLFAACGDAATPRVGVVVSIQPSSVAALAVADAAAAGHPVFEPVVRDPGPATAAADALRMAEALVADPRIIAVVGHSNSAASLAASQVYNSAGVVQIAPTTTATRYGDAGPFSFRMVPGDDRQAAFLAEAVRRGWPDARRIAVTYVNDDYGRSFYRELKPRLGPLVYEGVYAEMSDTTHLIELVQQIADTRPDVLIWIGRPLRLRMVLQPLRRLLPDLRVICGDACDDAVVYANTGGEFTGLRLIAFTDPYVDEPQRRALRDRYRDGTGVVASSEAVLTYDALRLIGAALADGVRTRRQLQRYLVSLGRERPAFEGLAGPVAFDSAGNGIRGYLLTDIVPAGAVRGTVPPR